MSDIADELNAQGILEWWEHEAGNCDEDCIYCEEEHDSDDWCLSPDMGDE